MRIIGQIRLSEENLSLQATGPTGMPNAGFLRQSIAGVRDSRTARMAPGMIPAINRRPTDVFVRIANMIITALGGIKGPRIPPVRSALRANDFL